MLGQDKSDSSPTDSGQCDHNKEIVNIALRYLCLREYSEKELKKKILQKHNFDKLELELAMQYLRSKDYLSDLRYIRQKSNLLKLKGFSASYIIRYLKAENLDVNLEKIEELDLISDEDNIKKLILKKTSKVIVPNLDHKKTQSIIRYVMSKGHCYQEIKSVLNSIKTEL